MKSICLLFLLTFLTLTTEGSGATTVNAANKYAYGADLGWTDWRPDTTNGAVIGEFVCSGYIYAANAAWINLGSGFPTNLVHYQNLSADDFGVNQDGLGNLRGYAYGANMGWINFENTGAPKVDLKSGKFSGYIYSANCGWISLSNAVAYVQTDSIAGGNDSNLNGLPDAWEKQNFGGLGVDPNADPDHDGMSNKQEYLAGTNPLDDTDKLRITAFTTTPQGTMVTLTWKSTLSRCYYIQKRLDLNLTMPWVDSGLGLIAADGAFTARTVNDSSDATRFYRIKAVRPLAP